jgi:hypothetical protein
MRLMGLMFYLADCVCFTPIRRYTNAGSSLSGALHGYLDRIRLPTIICGGNGVASWRW